MNTRPRKNRSSSARLVLAESSYLFCPLHAGDLAEVKGGSEERRPQNKERGARPGHGTAGENEAHNRTLFPVISPLLLFPLEDLSRRRSLSFGGFSGRNGSREREVSLARLWNRVRAGQKAI